VSIETRKARGQSYSTIAGFFKHTSSSTIARRRTRRHPRDERPTGQPRRTWYVYRLQVPRENIRRVFLDYLRAMNDMRERPRFYKHLTTNCNDDHRDAYAREPDAAPMSWKVLLSGYVPQYAYDAESGPDPPLRRAGTPGVDQRARACRRAGPRLLAAHPRAADDLRTLFSRCWMRHGRRLLLMLAAGRRIGARDLARDAEGPQSAFSALEAAAISSRLV